MTGAIPVRRIVSAVMLVIVWCALWGGPSAANVLGGAALAVLITALGIGPPLLGGTKARPLLQLVLVVARDLLRSTIAVAVEILTPTDHTNESVVAVRLPPDQQEHLLLLVTAITLTPGTAVVDTDPGSGTIYLHLLHHDRKDTTVRHVLELARLAHAALPGTTEARR